MSEIKFPAQRTFFQAKSADGKVLHQGFTESNQVTTTGQPVFVFDIDAGMIYPPLPATGNLVKGKVYSYNKGMVIVEQDHVRTAFTPEQTPNLFSIYRANVKGMAWIVAEQVIGGDERSFNGKTYKCIQSHQTQNTWNPELTLGILWQLVVTSAVWTIGIVYKVNDIVTYLGKTYKCLQAHTSISTWNPVATVNVLWQLQ